LNALTGKANFESGISLGRGLTATLQKHEYNGVVYMDTPGLADVEMRDEAAKHITEALRQNGQYQIFFVVNLNAGRISPADKTTMKLVLESVQGIEAYGIIINKVSKEVAEAIDKERKEFMTLLFAGLPRELCTQHIHFVSLEENLHDKKNATASEPSIQSLLRFMMSLPHVTVKAEQVLEIKDEFKEMMEANERLESKLKDMKVLQEEQERVQAILRSKMEEQAEAHSAAQAKLERELRDNAAEHEKAMREQEAKMDKLKQESDAKDRAQQAAMEAQKVKSEAALDKMRTEMERNLEAQRRKADAAREEDRRRIEEAAQRRETELVEKLRVENDAKERAQQAALDKVKKDGEAAIKELEKDYQKKQEKAEARAEAEVQRSKRLYDEARADMDKRQKDWDAAQQQQMIAAQNAQQPQRRGDFGDFVADVVGFIPNAIGSAVTSIAKGLFG